VSARAGGLAGGGITRLSKHPVLVSAVIAAVTAAVRAVLLAREAEQGEG
jgi:hypothetical protein